MMEQFLDTYSGKRIWFWKHIDSSQIDIEDIIHSLSAIGRFNGHTPRLYSVAEHSMLVARIVSPEHRLGALLHDAAEAYTGDMISPIKSNSGRIYKSLEKRIERAIEQHFGVQIDTPQIKRADLIALYIEAVTFYGAERIADWGWDAAIVEAAHSVFPSLPAIPMTPQTMANTKLLFRSALLRAGMNIMEAA